MNLELLKDSRLSSDARLLGLYIESLGDGEHELARDELGDVLTNGWSRERVQRAVAQLERWRWVTRKKGGRGHFDVFIFSQTCSELSDSESRQLKDSDSKSLPLRADSDSESLQLKPLEGREKVEEETPISPFAEKALEQHSEKLAGCRGALRDYLACLPVGRRQAAYVQTIAAYMDDIDPSVWRLQSGGWLAKEHRPDVLAVALNELAAGDEKMMKRPLGDPGNLKTKISILLQQREDNGKRHSQGDRKSQRAGNGSRAGNGPSKYSHLEGAADP